MTYFLRDIASYHRLLATLQLFFFYKFSNLWVHDDKTEIFVIGRHQLDPTKYSHKIRKSIKILGIVFDAASRMRANFDFVLKSIKEILNMWKCRGLTLLGRIQIVKSFILPNSFSKAALIAVSEDFIKEVNSLIYRFIWKGNEKIKHSTLINHIEDGGLRMTFHRWSLLRGWCY